MTAYAEDGQGGVRKGNLSRVKDRPLVRLDLFRIRLRRHLAVDGQAGDEEAKDRVQGVNERRR
jgi:hypothetical protein